MKINDIKDFLDAHEIDLSKFKIVFFCPCCEVTDKKLDVVEFEIKFEKIKQDEND